MVELFLLEKICLKIIYIYILKKDVIVDGKAAARGHYKVWAGRENEKRAHVNVWDQALPCWDA